MKKHLLSLAALLLFAGGAQAASQAYYLESVTYESTFVPTPIAVDNCTGCGFGNGLAVDDGAGNITLTDISWDFNAGGNIYSIAFDATTTLAGGTTLVKLPGDTCTQSAGSVCTATNVRSGMDPTSNTFYTGIASNGTTTCTNNRCRVDVFNLSATNLTILIKRALSESATSGNSQMYTLTFTAVPLPAGVWLFGSALGLLGLARRKLA